MVVLYLASTKTWYQQYAWSLRPNFFFFFVLTRTILGLCILDSIGFSLLAFMEICVIYSKYVAYVPIQIVEVIGALLPVYLIIYVIYRLVIWLKGLQIC